MTINKTELYKVTSDLDDYCIAVEENEFFNILELRNAQNIDGITWPFLNEKDMMDFKKSIDKLSKGDHWYMYHAYINENGKLWTAPMGK